MPPFPSPTAVWRQNTYPTISPSRPALSAQGRSVLVTGGGTGIGAETAHSFAEAGASRIALLGRRTQPLLDTKSSIETKFPGVQVFTASADVTKKEEVDAGFDKFAEGGKIDILVASAGFTGPLDAVDTVDPDAYMNSIDINVKGGLHTAQAFLRHASSKAVVVNVSSSAAHVNFGSGVVAYSVAKMANVRMWEKISVGHPEISIFSIQPGTVDTFMNREVEGVKNTGSEDHVSLPANFMVWLASSEAQPFKGKFLWANWDVDELLLRAKEYENTSQFSVTMVGFPFGEDDWKFKPSAGDWPA